MLARARLLLVCWLGRYLCTGSASTCMMALVYWLGRWPLSVYRPGLGKRATRRSSPTGSAFSARPSRASPRRRQRRPAEGYDCQAHGQHAQCALRLARVPCSSRPSAAQSNPPLQHHQKPVPKRSLISAHGLSLPAHRMTGSRGRRRSPALCGTWVRGPSPSVTFVHYDVRSGENSLRPGAGRRRLQEQSRFQKVCSMWSVGDRRRRANLIHLLLLK